MLHTFYKIIHRLLYARTEFFFFFWKPSQYHPFRLSSSHIMASPQLSQQRVVELYACMEYILCEKISDFHFSSTFFSPIFFFAYFFMCTFFFLTPPLLILILNALVLFHSTPLIFLWPPTTITIPPPFCTMKTYKSVTSATGIHLSEIRFLENCLNVFTIPCWRKVGLPKWWKIFVILLTRIKVDCMVMNWFDLVRCIVCLEAFF